MKSFQIVAIDGGAATGKTTICLSVARRLDFGYLNTGAYYRCLALQCLRSRLAPDDGDAMATLASELRVRLIGDPDGPAVYLDDEDVTRVVRSSSVTSLVSAASSDARVRSCVVSYQRAAATEMVAQFGGVVADGRDAATTIFPHAGVKILLVASDEARLGRYGRSSGSFEREVLERDRRDDEVTQFSRPGRDVVVKDSLSLPMDSLVDEIVGLARAARSSASSL